MVLSEYLVRIFGESGECEGQTEHKVGTFLAGIVLTVI